MMYRALFFVFSLTFLLLALACGRRGDPVAIVPYEEIGVVKDLEAFVEKDNVYLTWGIPEGEGFPRDAVKGYVVFRARVPEGVTVKDCDCQFRSLDFILTDGGRSEKDIGGKLGYSLKNYEYLDKKALAGQTYLYKIVVMDRNNKMGKDSNIVAVEKMEPLGEETISIPPPAPTGLVALYTQKNIVLTWDEVRGMAIKSYRVYRSDGRGFFVVGETSTPAFTDENVEPSKIYYYKVLAVGAVAGPLSEEIKVSTEVH